ncbi:MAG TPA: YciI family protein, partial [Devosia sp.]|nr:YciI family protein [Devosia sp.]
LVAHDRPNSVARRMELRTDHLKHLESLGDTLKLAGPFLDEAGAMVGSIMVVEADTLEAAREIFGRDPFMSGDLFETVTIERWKLTINNTAR